MITVEQALPGTKVVYWSAVTSNGSPLTPGIFTQITSLPWQLGHGEWIVTIAGTSVAGVSLKHLQLTEKCPFCRIDIDGEYSIAPAATTREC